MLQKLQKQNFIWSNIHQHNKFSEHLGSKECQRRWSYIKKGISHTWYDDVRLRKIVAKTFINFIKISLDKCGIVDIIQLSIQASICNGLSNNFISINLSGPNKLNQKSIWVQFIILQMQREKEKEKEEERFTFWQVSDQWCPFHKTGQEQFLIHLLWDQHILQWVCTKPLPESWEFCF